VVVFRYFRYAPNSDQILRRSEMTLCAKSKNKKNPGFVCRGIWHFKMPRGRQFEYAPEKLSKITLRA
jgi:hypothetical protein